MNQQTQTSDASGPPAQGELHPVEDLVAYCRQYARERPEVVALWSFGLGFILGWKLKLW